MKSINYAIHGLISSLLLNLGLTRLAERFDPMLQQSGRALARGQDATSAAFTDLPCQFKSSAFTDLPCQFAIQSAITLVRNVKSAAFTDLPCQFKSAAFTDLPCQFKSSAFTDLPCQFKSSAFTDLPCQLSAQSAS